MDMSTDETTGGFIPEHMKTPPPVPTDDPPVPTDEPPGVTWQQYPPTPPKPVNQPDKQSVRRYENEQFRTRHNGVSKTKFYTSLVVMAIIIIGNIVLRIIW